MRILLLLLIIGSAFLGCAKEEIAEEPGFKIIEIASPAGENSAEPNLVTVGDSIVYMSWIEKDSTTSTLYFSTFKDSLWSDAKKIAEGTDWFVNWADFPAMAVSANGTIIASFLQKSSAGTYSYDVKLTISKDNGTNWSEPFPIHFDSTNSEHGFVSIVALDSNKFAVTYLDGRETVKDKGAMSLRMAIVTEDGKIERNDQLDNMVCDCCQTSSVIAGNGNILSVYRDRLEGEIRDVSIVRYNNGLRGTSELIHADDWEMPGCPVNGPAIAVQDSSVAVSWYTKGTDTKPKIFISLSTDNGETFSDPYRVDNGDPVGRVDIAFFKNNNSIMVSWLEEAGDSAFVMLKEISSSGKQVQEVKLFATSAKRASGFPQLAAFGESFMTAFTDVSSGKPQLKTLMLK